MPRQRASQGRARRGRGCAAAGTRLCGAQLRGERRHVVVSRCQGAACAGRLRGGGVQPRLQLAGALRQRVRQRVPRAAARRAGLSAPLRTQAPKGPSGVGGALPPNARPRTGWRRPTWTAPSPARRRAPAAAAAWRPGRRQPALPPTQLWEKRQARHCAAKRRCRAARSARARRVSAPRAFPWPPAPPEPPTLRFRGTGAGGGGAPSDVAVLLSGTRNAAAEAVWCGYNHAAMATRATRAAACAAAGESMGMARSAAAAAVVTALSSPPSHSPSAAHSAWRAECA